jgi:hypothetical protein
MAKPLDVLLALIFKKMVVNTSDHTVIFFGK